MAKIKKQSKNNIVFHFISKLAFLIFVLYCTVSIIIDQVDIAKRKDELASIKAQVETLSEENDEYQRRLNTMDEGEYILRIALEDLGYAFPTERRFYDVSRN